MSSDKPNLGDTPSSAEEKGGDDLPAAYKDKTRKAIDQQGQVAPEDYPDRDIDNPGKRQG